MRLKTVVIPMLIAIVISGCSDSKESKSETASNVVSSPAKIEVVANENAKEIKVVQKKTDDSQKKSYYLDYNVNSEYDDKAQPANSDASVRVKPRTAIDANMHVRSPYENVKTSLLVRKLSKKFILKCSACHNDYANGIIGPSLLSKDADFIEKKIAEFKVDSAKNILMYELVNNMSDTEIKDMANEIYKFNQEIAKMRSK